MATLSAAALLPNVAVALRNDTSAAFKYLLLTQEYRRCQWEMTFAHEQPPSVTNQNIKKKTTLKGFRGQWS